LDTPTAESNAPLNVDGAANAFAQLLDPAPEPVEKEAQQDVQAQEEQPVEAEAPEGDAPAEDGEDGTVEIEVDGKLVKLSKAELADAYKSGLRQADYTKKTMEVAEQRKAAEAETAKARQEREEYAGNLQKMAAQLEGAIEQQQKIDWNALLESDPVEYMRQQHLYQQRQAAYEQNLQEQQKVASLIQAEQQQAAQAHLMEQRDKLLAKLPEWKDDAKAKADKQAISDYLKEQGFEAQAIENINDHRAVIMARKAMLYDQMVAKASAAAKKVAAAPQRVVKPGVGESQRVDGRSSAMQRLGKSGRVEDAAAVFAGLI